MDHKKNTQMSPQRKQLFSVLQNIFQEKNNHKNLSLFFYLFVEVIQYLADNQNIGYKYLSRRF
jgi:hypothetical protein